MDFIIVIISIVAMMPNADGIAGLRALRAFRALRPLRSIKRMHRLKLVITALAASIGPILQTMLLIGIFFLIFATLGITYFQGTMYKCEVDYINDPSLGTSVDDAKIDLILCNGYNDIGRAVCMEWGNLSFQQQQQWAAREQDIMYAAWVNYLAVEQHNNQTDTVFTVTPEAQNIIAENGIDEVFYESLNVSYYIRALNNGTKHDYIKAPVTSRMICEWMGYSWVAIVPQSFNDFFASFGALFEISTTEGWIDVMWASADVRGVDMQPIRDANPWSVIFFYSIHNSWNFFCSQSFCRYHL
jgi:hypothetical protein